MDMLAKEHAKTADASGAYVNMYCEKAVLTEKYYGVSHLRATRCAERGRLCSAIVDARAVRAPQQTPEGDWKSRDSVRGVKT